MNKKYILGGVIVTGFLAILIFMFTQTNIGYENDFKKIMEKPKKVKATGSWVKEKRYEQKDNMLTFYMKDAAGTEMKVMYHGTLPNNFESATGVVVTGKYRDGFFHADDILTKCPSKYQDKKAAEGSAS